MGVSTAAGAVYGSIVPGVAVFFSGVLYMVGTEVWEPGGKSLKERGKDIVYNWWTQDNSNWQMPNNSFTNKNYYYAPTVLPTSK